MRVLSILVTFLLGLGGLTLQTVAASAIKPGLAFEEGFAPIQDLTVWHLQIARGYPLVRTQIGDVQGVLMLDTGTPFGLLLNSARLKLPESRFVFSGTAGSGQKFDVSGYSTPAKVERQADPELVKNGLQPAQATGSDLELPASNHDFLYALT